jgi:hypothetical protein
MRTLQPSSKFRTELMDLARGPLVIAIAVGIGIEVFFHMFQLIVIVAVLGSIGCAVGFARNGKTRYPLIYSAVGSWMNALSGRAARK